MNQSIGGRLDEVKSTLTYLDQHSTAVGTGLTAVSEAIGSAAAQTDNKLEALHHKATTAARADAMAALETRVSEDGQVVRGLAGVVPPRLDGVDKLLKAALRKHDQASARIDQVSSNLVGVTVRLNACLTLVGVLVLWSVVRSLWA